MRHESLIGPEPMSAGPRKPAAEGGRCKKRVNAPRRRPARQQNREIAGCFERQAQHPIRDPVRKDTGIGRFPSHLFALNQAWLAASLTAAILLAWLKLLALDGGLAKAEPKTLRYRVLHSAARLVRGGRRRRLKIQATWPWAEAITAAWQRIDALPQAP